jgi:ABC-type branched-subunit amino acid transport system ATPase component
VLVECVIEQTQDAKNHGVTMLMVDENTTTSLETGEGACIVHGRPKRKSHQASAVLDGADIQERYLDG